jgi:hypothetical protein
LFGFGGGILFLIYYYCGRKMEESSGLVNVCMFICLEVYAESSRKSMYSQLEEGIRIYRRHQVTHGMRGGGTYGYTAQKKERNEKQMKNVSKQEIHVQHQNHQTTQENTGNS